MHDQHEDNRVAAPTNSTVESRHLLGAVHACLTGLRSARAAYAKRFAPEFNVLSLLRTDELRLSAVLAELLDPAGSHAQGRCFWDAFVEVLRCPAWMDRRQVVKVRTETSTTTLERSERRIDIVIELDGTAAVAIENKPWAIDQPRQVADYLAHLKQRYPGGHMLIYLAPDQRGPGEASIPVEERASEESNETLRVVGFSELLPWLRACRSACEAPSVTAFLADVEHYICKEFKGVRDMTEMDALVAEVTRSPEAIEAAFNIARAEADVRKKLLGDLEAQLRQWLQRSQRPWTLSMDSNWSDKAQGFSFQFAPNDRCTLRFQFELNDYRHFFFGISKPPEVAHPDGVCEALDDEFGCRSLRENHWIWYRDFEPPLWDWRLNSLPWQRIANGEMAKMIIELTEKAFLRLERDTLLTRLHSPA